MRSSHRVVRRREAFTLIELLIVITIITLLVGLSIPAIVRARETGNKTACINNLRQFAVGFQNYATQYTYFPTAGDHDWAAPMYNLTSGNAFPVAGYQQDAGWGFQILPFIDAENTWLGTTNTGTSPSTAVAAATAALKTPSKFFFCPTRRQPRTSTVSSANFPVQSVYSSLASTSVTVFLSDYAACNGNWNPATGTDGTGKIITNTGFNNGICLSQNPGNATTTTMGTTTPNNSKATVAPSDVVDGLATTLMLGEKAVCWKDYGTVPFEDDVGFFSGFGQKNFNTIRFASSGLLPVNDFQVSTANSGATGGAFGAAHTSTWNAAMADASVRQLSYSINSTVYNAIATISGRENISDADILP
jgi:prepilin-type N-terminal cleavage/methylation domain-containing protein